MSTKTPISKDLDDLYEIVRVNCTICLRNLGPSDRGIFIKGAAICEACAQEIWKKLEGY